jgi:hypothetical protein
MVAPLDVLGGWPVGHVSGPANGVLDYPIDFYALALDDAPDSYVGSGVIYIDDLSCAQVIAMPTPSLSPSPQLTPYTPLTPSAPSGSSTCRVDLIGPPDGAHFGPGDETVTLRWQIDRPLVPNEYFFVNVEFPHDGQTWYDGTWRDPSRQLPDGTQDTQWTLRDYLCQPGFSNTGWYEWYVVVLYQLGPEKSLSDGFVCRSDKREFKWSGCVPTPTPTEDTGPYP